MQWVFCADGGKRHHIGIYHGDRTGHVLIHCNSKIVTIDFGVQSDKTYTFFIDDELCNIEVEKQSDGFAYGFKIDQETITPKNIARKERNSQDAKKLILGLLGFILIISIIVFLLYRIG